MRGRRARTGAGRGPAARPGVLRGRGAAPTAAARAHRVSVTGRAAVLAVVVAVVVVMLALPLKVYVSQRHSIDRLQRQTDQQQQRVSQLQQQAARWNDPAYVKAQARARLHLVMPGETAYVVLGGKDPAATGPASPTPRAAVPHQPWYSRLWHTAEAAGGTAGAAGAARTK